MNAESWGQQCSANAKHGPRIQRVGTVTSVNVEALSMNADKEQIHLHERKGMGAYAESISGCTRTNNTIMIKKLGMDPRDLSRTQISQTRHISIPETVIRTQRNNQN